MRDAEIEWSCGRAEIRLYEFGFLVAIETAEDWDSADEIACAWESYDLEAE